ncbi:hypothetical protein D3C79_917210 [compost metagenome]
MGHEPIGRLIQVLCLSAFEQPLPVTLRPRMLAVEGNDIHQTLCLDSCAALQVAAKFTLEVMVDDCNLLLEQIRNDHMNRHQRCSCLFEHTGQPAEVRMINRQGSVRTIPRVPQAPAQKRIGIQLGQIVHINVPPTGCSRSVFVHLQHGA